ncbi:hypothetical protein OTSUT76_3438 [Orientia tsutsugamushi str. UT76]|uniref:Integrase n=1 Tax=Orientia tsutsugamushi TaxID=784 RepID=A0A2U3RFU7_ORITS|nr:hypothetical protein OTSUT76_3438 [Orientia tsutsugamushi str. UT76]SPR12104.1 Uncharacterised protein [Orientia tsutsugamushi]
MIIPSISLKFTNRALRKIKTPKEKKPRIYSDKVVQWLRGRKSSSGRLTLYVEQKFKNQSFLK